LACARHLFAERGYHLTSVAEIIARAGVARGTFYLHFPSKRALFDELSERLFAALAGTVRRIEVGPEAPPPLDQMHANVLGVVTLLLSERELTRILLRESGVDAEFDRKRGEFYDRLLGRIRQGIELGQQMGLVRPSHAPTAAACILGSIKEVMIQVQEPSDQGKPLKPLDLAKEILDYVVRGLFWPLQK
jgi:AcrR family transcriptional regulator